MSIRGFFSRFFCSRIRGVNCARRSVRAGRPSGTRLHRGTVRRIQAALVAQQDVSSGIDDDRVDERARERKGGA